MVLGKSDHRIGFWIAVLFASLIPIAPVFGETAEGTKGGRQVVLSGSHDDQQFVSGRTIRINATVNDDLFVAGGDIELTDASAEALLVAGGDVRLHGVTAHDIFVVGGNVSVSGGILDDLVGAAGMIRIRREADILDDARLAGGTVEMAGRIGGDLFASGGRIALSGEVMGNVFVAGRHVVILPGTRIHGDLRYVGELPPEVAEDVAIGGAISPIEGGLLHFKEPGSSRFGIGTLIAWLIGTVSLIVASAVFQILFPNLVATCVNRVRRQRLFSLALGLALFVATPVIVLLLIVTVIGLPVGLVLLTFYPAFMILAALITSAAIGSQLGRWFGRVNTEQRLPLDGATLGWTALGMLVLTLLPGIPYIGFVFALVLVLGGLGALTAESWNRLQAGRNSLHGSVGKGSTRSR